MAPCPETDENFHCDGTALEQQAGEHLHAVAYQRSVGLAEHRVVTSQRAIHAGHAHAQEVMGGTDAQEPGAEWHLQEN